MNNKTIIIPIIITIILLGITLYVFINVRTINYIDKSKTYNIKLINNKVILKTKETVICIKNPCPKKTTKKEINFYKDSNKIILDFIKRKTGIKKKKTIKKEELSEYELRIIESIIYNDEDILINEKIPENAYIVETDMRLKTMRNDGGSNTNIYYIIDLDNKKVTKKEEDYYAPENNLKKKTFYKKTIDKKLANKIKKVLNDSINNNSNENKIYEYYKIIYKNKENYIYNKTIIKKIEDMLLDLDYY